ncbi:PA-phosphatase [Synechococcus sp. MIT S9503]|uniref:PA-phosphatase n=1 Tax=Synechococcus sp. MIT S9503 TaxID=3082547 RepID=UPI0039A5699F
MKIRRAVLACGLVAGVSAVAITPAEANPADGLALNLAPLANVVGKPPLPGSDRLKRDLAVLRWQQFARDSGLVGHAWSYLGREIGRFQAAIGSDFEKTAPLIGAGVPQFVRLVDEAKNQLKVVYDRSRPFLSYPDLKPCLPLESSQSYPSGHATWYVSTSLLLADLLPEHRERLLAVGH